MRLNLQLTFSLAKVKVVRYEGPKVSKEKLEEWENIYYSQFHSARTRKEAELHEVPEAVQYRRVRDAWMRNKYMEYRNLGARFGVKLHSTERGRVPDKHFVDPDIKQKIHFRLEHHFRARKMPKILESYRQIFEQFESDHVFYYGPQEEPHAEMMTLELFNDPQYVSTDQAEALVRHFLRYMVWGASHWNQLQQKYKT